MLSVRPILSAFALACMSPSILGRVRFDPEPAPTAPLPPAPAAPPPASAPKPITQADLDAALERQRNQIFATLRKSSAPAPAPVEPVEPPAPPAPDEPKSLREKLDRIERERQAEKQSILDDRRDTAIDRALSVFTGLDAEDIADVKSLFVQRFGKAIKVEGKEVFFETADGERKGLDAAIAEFQKTKTAQRYMPKRDMPGGNGMKGGGNAGAAGTGGAHPWAAKPFKEIMTLSKTQPELFYDFMTNHAELYAQKKKES